VVEQGLHIALVAPFSWTQPSAVDQHVGELARALKARGHRPVVVTSFDDAEESIRTKALFHRTRGPLVGLLADYRAGADPDALLLPTAGKGPLEPGDGIPVIPVGYSFPVRLNRGVANLGLPVDITSRLEKLLVGADFDLVHVHEPLAPSLGFTALRESRCPVFATFHMTPVAAAAYDLGQPVLERFFNRLDGRAVTFPGARDMLVELYPGEYEVVPCGSSIRPSDGGSPARTAAYPAGSSRYALHVYEGDARRSLRALLRALAEDWPCGLDRLVIAFHQASAQKWPPRAVPRKLRSRVDLVRFESVAELGPVYEGAAVAILPFLGGEWLCHSIADAAVCGCPIVGPDLPPVRDYLAPAGAASRSAGSNGPVTALGAVFSPNDFASVATAIQGVLGAASRPVVEGPAAAARPQPSPYSLAAVAERLEELYRETIATATGDRVAGRTPAATRSLHVRGIGEESPRRWAREAAHSPARPDWINADLHMHTTFSKDSKNSVETIIRTAREIGLGAIAVTDHNEIKGALRARELAEGDPFVIVAEEIKSREGEVIGLFLKEWIPPRLSFDETLSRIKEQGALVYVPHPFDALRTTPSYQALVDNLHRIDVIEIYNAKVALSAFNLAAERFAAKYNIVAGAGSDAHVRQALGTAMLRMPRFHDPGSFMAALWEADIIARRKNLLYLQSLKLLQTTLDRVLPED
jgi:predicted metal-dependent phosphoesterase TrpH/glycosyltransferase involved in cell wall biosynthesis